MAIEALNCPHCGAPLSARALRGVSECEYCGRTLLSTGAPGRWGSAADLSRELPEGPWRGEGAEKIRVGDRRVVVLGRLAEGDGCDVFLARSDSRLAELLLLKAPRTTEAEAHLTRGWRALERLQESETQGAEFFSGLLPQQVALGRIGGAKGRFCGIYRYRSGFVHTFEDLLAEHRGGVDGKAIVWLWKRVLELLGWVHQSGWVHGAVLPQHLLVHARDHGVTLVGWSAATSNARAAREPLPLTSEPRRAFYPEAQWQGRPATPASDLTMTARCVLYALGGDVEARRVPASVPAAISALLEAYLDDGGAGRTDDAWALKERVSEAGRAAYGPPRFNRLRMPGWT